MVIEIVLIILFMKDSKQQDPQSQTGAFEETVTDLEMNTVNSSKNMEEPLRDLIPDDPESCRNFGQEAFGVKDSRCSLDRVIRKCGSHT